MDAGAWLILTVILKSGTPYVVAWPAPSMERCEHARTFIPEPTRSETRCSDERPKADRYAPQMPEPISGGRKAAAVQGPWCAGGPADLLPRRPVAASRPA